ncbi:MAG: DegT/DnrJ/EryC1/StrS aminotransferase family protein [Deltaproteobacteria bacterium]|nr:DegT/DnrJ/EryC1/StrS aminotransferase family protein [Deltaproteobacteria bacterium]
MIPLNRASFFKEKEAIDGLCEYLRGSDKFSMGSKCREFENRFARFQGRKYGVCFNSGASANLCLLQSLLNLGRLQRGDAVGFSGLTWSTNVMPLFQFGFTPIPVDCSPEFINVSSRDLERRLEDQTLKCLFITNALGFTGDLDRIRDICAKRDILLLEDNCESLGTELPSGKAGNFGLAATFSFYVAHHMSTIEGGMACTDDQELYEMLVISRANGWDRNLDPAVQQRWREKYGVPSEFESKYTFYDLAFNLRPTEITGVLGLHQLKHLEENVDLREKNYLAIERAFLANDELKALDHGHITKLSSFAVPIVCASPQLRAKYLARFQEADVEVRPMIAGNICEQPFYLKYADCKYDLPGTDFISQSGFYCGNYPELTERDIQIIVGCLG